MFASDSCDVRENSKYGRLWGAEPIATSSSVLGHLSAFLDRVGKPYLNDFSLV